MKKSNTKKSTSFSIRLENLTKIFHDQKSGRETVAVNNFDVLIPEGKLVGLLGPSGCGKSTTLFMIAGLHAPTSGKIFFNDEDITELTPEKRGIGLVFQNYALYPHMTIYKNISFPLENMRLRQTAIKNAYREAYTIEMPDVAKVYYEYMDKLDNLNNKYSRLETEAKQAHKNLVFNARTDYREVRKTKDRDKIREAKLLFKNQKTEYGLDLKAKLAEYEEKYVEEKLSITPENHKELLKQMKDHYREVERDYKAKARELRREYRGDRKSTRL